MLNTDWFHEDDDSDENESQDEDGGGVDGVYDEVNEGLGGRRIFCCFIVKLEFWLCFAFASGNFFNWLCILRLSI